jgi:RNA polymerase sigma-70 factor (ECF subfamily)
LAAVTTAGRASGLEPVGLCLDSRAEEALYRRHAGRVLGFCLSQLGRREDAEDAVQTTFLHAMRSLRRGVVPLVETAWLIGIARNVCRERWETAGRRSRLESTCDPQDLARVGVAPEGRREELIGLEDALTRVPEQQRRAILLRDWRGLSYDEVAQQLGVSRAAVETLIFRGRRTLAAQLRQEPQRTRRRLASLGDLGSLLAAAKAALTGAAAATKVAAAVGVTAIAVGGAGVAITSSAPGMSEPPAAQVDPQASPVPVPAHPSVAARPHRAPAPVPASSPRPRPAREIPVAVEVTAITAARTSPAPRPTNTIAPVPAPMPAPTPPASAATPVPPVTAPVEAVSGSNAAVTIETVAEPVTAPVVEIAATATETLPPVPPVAAVPPVAVPLPAPLPVPPVGLP